jgi:hypothetical protein
MLRRRGLGPSGRLAVGFAKKQDSRRGRLRPPSFVVAAGERAEVETMVALCPTTGALLLPGFSLQEPPKDAVRQNDWFPSILLTEVHMVQFVFPPQILRTAFS